MQIRSAEKKDVPAIRAIYSHHVETGFGSFETAPPARHDMRARVAAIIEAGYPYLIAEDEGRIVGYAYANQYRPRIGYRFTVEDSVYVAPTDTGRGIGRALLNELIERCVALDLKQMLAFIGDSQNAASIGVHRACGFAHVGTLTSVGHKFERWVDVVMMQRTL